MQIEEEVFRRWGALGKVGLGSSEADVLRPTEEGSRLFSAEVFLPVQATPSRADHWLQRLCLALLLDALKCVWTPGRRQREAWEWMRSEAEYCFSFSTVCAVLNLDAQAMRREVAHHLRPGPARAGGESGRPQRLVRGRSKASVLAL
jgi:hypothetical protein